MGKEKMIAQVLRLQRDKEILRNVIVKHNNEAVVNNASFSIVQEELDDIKYLIDEKFSAEAIEIVSGETTCGTLLDILCLQ